MSDTVFRKYSKRVKTESILRSVLLALAVGSVVLAVTELLSWFFGFKAGIWLGPLLLVAVTAALAPILYFKKYKPSAKEIAARVDELGLEERVLTMTELEGEDSFIARKQREDTVGALRHTNHTLIRVTLSAVIVAALCVGGVFGAGTLTTEALHVAGVIPSGMELLAGETVKKTYTVTYGVELGEGEIVLYEDNQPIAGQAGKAEFKVTEGEDAPAVYARAKNAEEQWVFVRWTDGLRDPYRSDIAVSGDIIVGAIFVQLGDIDVEDPQLPPPPSAGEGSGDPEDGDGSNDQSSSPQDPSGDPGSGDEQEGGGTNNDASLQIYDGQTYYGDDYSNAYEEGMGRLGADENLSDKQKGWIQDYFESIERSDGSEEGDGE